MKRKYKITIGPEVTLGFPADTAILSTDDGDGYLWLGYNNECIGWIDNRQLDAIAKQWLKVRGYTVAKL